VAGRDKQDPAVDDLADGSGERSYSVRAVERVCAILNLLQGSIEGVSLLEVAQATDLPKSSAFRYLWTLEARRYVERDADTGLFRLGLGFVGMQSQQVEMLRQRARPWLEKLRDQYEETANLGILDGDSVIYLDSVESRRSVRLSVSRGDRDAVHATALGKAIAAELSEAQAREVLSHAGMSAKTDRTITDPETYMKELAEVRRAGYALDNCENESDGRCVAVPIRGMRLPVAVSISAPSSRFLMSDVDGVAASLRDVAKRIAVGFIPGRLADARS
jgi:IclR family acetate operon transcriptional repressor